jgi:type II secretory pathway component PulM
MIRGRLMFTPSQAATAVNVSKATIHRAIKSGKLSASRHEDGTFSIDPSELHRVFETAHIAQMKRDETAPERNDTAVIQTELTGVRALQALLERQIEDLKTDRDAWRSQAEAAQRLLTDARPKQGLLARIFKVA